MDAEQQLQDYRRRQAERFRQHCDTETSVSTSSVATPNNKKFERSPELESDGLSDMSDFDKENNSNVNKRASQHVYNASPKKQKTGKAVLDFTADEETIDLRPFKVNGTVDESSIKVKQEANMPVRVKCEPVKSSIWSNFGNQEQDEVIVIDDESSTIQLDSVAPINDSSNSVKLDCRPPLPNAQGLLEYQIPHVNHMFDVFSNGNRGLDASETGTGKTYMTIYLCMLLNLRPFIICPKSVILTWMEVAEGFGVKLLGVANYEMIKGCKHFDNSTEPVDCPYIQKAYSDEADQHMEGTESDHTFRFSFPKDAFIIFDEAHRCKNHKTSTSKLLQSASQLENRILLLSATISDKVDCFKAFGMFFGFYDTLKGYSSWMRRQLAVKKVEHDNKDLTDVQRKLDIMHHSLMPKFGHRIRIKDLGDMFPENQIIARCHYLAKSYEIQKLYMEIKSAFEDLKDKTKRSTALGRIVRIRQKIEILKVPIFIEQSEKFLEEGYSIVIFCNFQETLSQLQLKLNCECVVQGQQTLEERKFAINQFQTNKSRVIICNIKAGGVGLSLQDKDGGYPRVALFNPTWSGQDMVQGFGRIHRAGGKTPAKQHLIYVGETYETKICEMINEKIHNLQGINDGDLAGVDLDQEDIKAIDSMLPEDKLVQPEEEGEW